MINTGKLRRAAIFVIARNGFYGATTDKIAAKAKVLFAPLNRYFNAAYRMVEAASRINGFW